MNIFDDSGWPYPDKKIDQWVIDIWGSLNRLDEYRNSAEGRFQLERDAERERIRKIRLYEAEKAKEWLAELDRREEKSRLRRRKRRLYWNMTNKTQHARSLDAEEVDRCQRELEAIEEDNRRWREEYDKQISKEKADVSV